MRIQDWYSNIPKAELHRHLEGSVRVPTIAEVAKHHNLPLPHKNLKAMRDLLEIHEPMKDLKTVIDIFIRTQSTFVAPEVIERITFETIEDAWYDGIRLLEIRYCPSFLVKGHQLTFEDAFDAIQKGMQRARGKYQMGVALIMICSRAHGLKVAEETLAHAIKHKDAIAAFDLADPEVGFEFAGFDAFFAKVRAAGFALTIHAGEEPGTALNVAHAIERYQTRRIGHGLQISRAADVRELVRNRGVTLELCPTSNYLTRCVDTVASHPLPKLLRAGIKVTINSDDPAPFAIDLSHEYRVCGEVLHCSRDEIQSMRNEAIASSFLDPDEKEYLRGRYFA